MNNKKKLTNLYKKIDHINKLNKNKMIKLKKKKNFGNSWNK